MTGLDSSFREIKLVTVWRLHWMREVQEAESPVRRLVRGGADHVGPS